MRSVVVVLAGWVHAVFTQALVLAVAAVEWMFVCDELVLVFVWLLV